MKHRNSTSEVQEWLWFGLKPECHSATNSCLLGISEPTSSSMSATGLQQNCALMPTFCFFGGERWEGTWEVVNPNSRLKLYSSLPPPTAVDSSHFTQANKAYGEKSQLSRGESFSDMSGNDMQLNFLAWFKLHNAGGFPMYLVWAEGWRGREMTVII